jgi:hypothetical protein
MVLGASALANGVAHETHPFSPEKVKRSGFARTFPEIGFEERGSGFWAWKPFIIDKVLEEVGEGDLVFYCDVGRDYPFKRLTACLPPLLRWMEENRQAFLPGVEIPWDGPMSVWTKRDAFVYTGMDDPVTHAATPVQASFSLWKAGEESRRFVRKWMEGCKDRRLLTDDPSICGLEELPDFRDHRHDQALLTLCCLKEGIRGLSLGREKPPIDSKHPSQVAKWLDPDLGQKASKMVEVLARALELPEILLRRLSGK